MAAKFPRNLRQHAAAINYAGSYGAENNEVPEPDWDNSGYISTNYSKYLANPASMNRYMQAKYLYYLQRAQKLSIPMPSPKVLKF